MLEFRMFPSGRFSFQCLFLMGFAASGLGLAQQAQPASGTVPTIPVYITASAKDGSPATPDAASLSALVDKEPAKVISLRPAKDEKLLFALAIDTSRSQEGDAKKIKSAAMELFKRLLAEGNEGYLAVFDDSFAVSKRPITVPEMQYELDHMTFAGGTALNDAISKVCEQTLKKELHPDFPRRAIILITDGGENGSLLKQDQSWTEAEKEGIPIFSLIPRPGNKSGQRYLAEAAERTGGKVSAPDRYDTGVEPLLADINGQWVLEIGATQFADRRPHSLEVVDSRGEVIISAPRQILFP